MTTTGFHLGNILSRIEEGRRPRSILATEKRGRWGTVEVYFVQADTGGPIKIGWSTHAASRLKGLQCGSPLPLSIIGVMRTQNQNLEKRIHRRFQHLRLHGEWFKPEPELIEYISRNSVLGS